MRGRPVDGGAEDGGGVRVGLECGEGHGEEGTVPGRCSSRSRGSTARARRRSPRGLRRRSAPCCCASRAASRSPSGSARWSRTRRCTSTRAPRRCSTPRRAPSSSPSSSGRGSRRARPSSSTASSTPRSPTRARAAGSAWRRSGGSTCSARAGCCPTGRCCCGSTRRPRWPVRRAAARPPTGSSRRSADFFAAIAAAYDALAAAEPERFAVIDAAQPPDAVLADCLAAVARSVRVAVRVRRVPGPGVGDHVLEAAGRAPAEPLARAGCVGHQRRRVAGAARPPPRRGSARPSRGGPPRSTSRTVKPSPVPRL